MTIADYWSPHIPRKVVWAIVGTIILASPAAMFRFGWVVGELNKNLMNMKEELVETRTDMLAQQLYFEDLLAQHAGVTAHSDINARVTRLETYLTITDKDFR